MNNVFEQIQAFNVFAADLQSVGIFYACAYFFPSCLLVQVRSGISHSCRYLLSSCKLCDLLLLVLFFPPLLESLWESTCPTVSQNVYCAGNGKKSCKLILKVILLQISFCKYQFMQWLWYHLINYCSFRLYESVFPNIHD